MLDVVLAPLNQAVIDRLTLFLNHVLASESAATQRLQAHAGRVLSADWSGWLPFLPQPPRMAWVVTPAGLLERSETPDPADLRVVMDASDPMRWWAAMQAGERPPMDIQGDAQLASDVSWLIDNVRWDVEDDLARVIGELPARQLASMGRGLVAALRRFTEAPRR
jgi:ubiquinone biosynthesis accessory factor UbiJ